MSKLLLKETHSKLVPMVAPQTAQQKAFARVYQQELSYVWKVLTRLGLHPKEREDLAHDIFATAFRQWHQYDPARPVRPWLFGIAYRRVLDHKRKHQNHREETVAEISATDTSRSADEQVARSQGLDAALKALLSLEIERRAIFILHEIEETPMPEVAESLGIPLNTAYTRLRLARRDFNEAIEATKTKWEVTDGKTQFR